MMFWRYIKFELKYQFTAKKSLIIAAILMLGLIAYFVFNITMHQEAESVRREALLEEQVLLGPDLIFYHQRPVPGFDPEISDILRDMLEADNMHLSRQISLINWGRPMMPGADYPWQSDLIHVINRNEAILSYFYIWRQARAAELGIDPLEVNFTDATLPTQYRLNHTEASLMTTIAFHRYLQNAGLRPIHSEYDPQALQLMYRLIAGFTLFVLPILVVFLAADVFSRENDNASYKFLLLQPLSRIKIYLAKYLSSFVLCLAAFIVPVLILFVISWIIFGMGQLGYPVEFAITQPQLAAAYESPAAVLARLNPAEMPQGFVAIEGYLLRALPLIGLYIAFMVSLTTFISMVAKDSIFAIAASMGLVMATLAGIEYGQGVIAAINPIAFADINGLMREYSGVPLAYLALSALIVTIIGLIWFRRKDIIC